MYKNNGFTLIELLVVISIISLLSSIALASISVARNKAKDSKVYQTINNLKTENQLFIDSSSPFNTYCAGTQIFKLYSSVNGTCLADASGWAVYLPLNNPPVGKTGWCMDSTEKSNSRNGNICNTNCTGICAPE